MKILILFFIIAFGFADEVQENDVYVDERGS